MPHGRAGVGRVSARALRGLPFREGLSVTDAILEVQDLVKHFPVKLPGIARLLWGGNLAVHAVDGVSFSLRPGEIFGLVGESGCGKTTVGRTVLRLLEPTSGSIRFEGMDITHLKEKELRPLRKRMQIIFQDPHASLNPGMTIGQSIADPLIIHEAADEREAKRAALEIMTEVGLAPAEQMYGKYPADLSGGQKQRAVIARAMILKPQPRGEVPDAVHPPAGCRFHPRCPVAMPTCGWEGRDFVAFLELRWLSAEIAAAEAALGPIEEWTTAGPIARRRVRDADPGALAVQVRGIVGDVESPMSQAIEAVEVEEEGLVVRFRPPAPLEPKEVEGRLVECLLY